MRPVQRYAVYLVAITLFSGCGTTSSSRNDSFSPAGDAVSGSSNSRSSDSGSRSSFPAPPPGAPPAYGVSFVRPIGFLKVFDSHCDDESACADACADTCTDACAEDCGEKCSHSCRLFSFGDKLCFGKSRHQSDCCEPADCCESTDCATDCCAEGCDTRQHHGLFKCFRLKGLCGLFSHGKCGDDCGEECCAAEESCCNNECCDTAECGDGCSESGCFDFGQQSVRQPCLADSLDDSFMNESIEPSPAPEEVPPATPPHVPDAPEPVDPTPPQANFGWPFTKVSKSDNEDIYFPSADGEEREIVEPQMWRGRKATSISEQQTIIPQTPPATTVMPPIRIQPRLTVY